jgi:hypothetical protein
MAALYADKYDLLITAGSDNHWGNNVFTRLREKGFRPEIAGVCSDTAITGVQDYISMVKEGSLGLFLIDEEGRMSYADGKTGTVPALNE